MRANSRRPEPAATEQDARPSVVASTLLFLGGAAAGLGIHETGHVIFSATFDANPRVAPLHYGLIPFFKIEHDPVTRRQEFVISSAGFWMQYRGFGVDSHGQAEPAS